MLDEESDNGSQEKKSCRDDDNGDLTLIELSLPRAEFVRISQLIVGAEDDPPLILDWNVLNLQAFITNIAVYAGPNMPPFVLPNPLNMESFQDAILEHWRTAVGGMTAKVGRVCLPASAAKLATLATHIGIEAMNPWWRDINNVGVGNCFPLARLYTLRPRHPDGLLDGIYPAGHNHPWQ